jgi:hypothetical protein
MSQRIGGVTVPEGGMKGFGFGTTLYYYDCRQCGKPGTDNHPNTRVHPYCRAAWKAAKDKSRKRR